jgi:hypothetical protein
VRVATVVVSARFAAVSCCTMFVVGCCKREAVECCLHLFNYWYTVFAPVSS